MICKTLIGHEIFNVFRHSIQSFISITSLVSARNPNKPFAPENSHLFLNKLLITAALLITFNAVNINAERTELTLKKGWEFSHGDVFDESKAQKVTIPHDWAISGPFTALSFKLK